MRGGSTNEKKLKIVSVLDVLASVYQAYVRYIRKNITLKYKYFVFTIVNYSANFERFACYILNAPPVLQVMNDLSTQSYVWRILTYKNNV